MGTGQSKTARSCCFVVVVTDERQLARASAPGGGKSGALRNQAKFYGRSLHEQEPNSITEAITTSTPAHDTQ